MPISGKHLTFSLKGDMYAVPLNRVREIVGMLPFTPIPNSSGSLLGVVNLRGQIIPVVDLRIHFNMEAVDSTRETCIIIVEIGTAEVGIVVDTVEDVYDLSESDLDDSHAAGYGSRKVPHVAGISRADGKVVIIVELSYLLPKPPDNLDAGEMIKASA